MSARMTLEATPTVHSAHWSSRVAVFSVALLLVTLVLHRFAAMPTPLAINLFVVALAGAGLAVLIGLGAMVRIWFTGHAGAGSAALGVLVGAVALSGPVGYGLTHYNLPRINDVTTDADNPFELVEEAVRRLKWSVVMEEPPTTGKEATPGVIEATEQTLFAGFTDDIVIRIEGTATRAKIDARSASRYGSFDLGQNAARLRRLFAEIRARMEVTPSVAVATGAKDKKRKIGSSLFKRKKGADPRKAGSRYGRGPSK
jgi:uncharacterized protein (DUF1499 family)